MPRPRRYRLEPDEDRRIVDGVQASGATGPTTLIYPSVVLAAWCGREEPALELIAAGRHRATSRGDRRALALIEYATAVLYNGLGHYGTALRAAVRATDLAEGGVLMWSLAELVEAGARSANRDIAAAALRRLDRMAIAETRVTLSVRTRSRAILSDRADAERRYREALDRLNDTRLPLQLARGHLLYGEWLRRTSRRVDARDQLHAAVCLFDRIGAEGFAGRCRRELLATGEVVRKRTVGAEPGLTSQEQQIARMAGAGLTNAEIGTRLFLSPRTIEWHLRKVFAKLDVSSRRDLRGVALPPRTDGSPTGR